VICTCTIVPGLAAMIKLWGTYDRIAFELNSILQL